MGFGGGGGAREKKLAKKGERADRNKIKERGHQTKKLH